MIKVLQIVEKTQQPTLVEEHRYMDVVTGDGLLTNSFRAKFGRKRVRRTPFIYDQTLEDLNQHDHALWNEKRYFIKVFGFASLVLSSGKASMGQWHTFINRPRFCPVVVSDRMIDGVITSEFSLLTALSKTQPFVRPLCIYGDPKDWLTVSADNALTQLFKWQVGDPDLVFPT
ncbi:hypothetical protein GGR60_000240 [Xanthomonas arboricola]|uniref:hypothetical protein n=1 Tax=Xanthomonas euroxanthea TaxID=2259622 RepID=UPI00141AB375|nr:hypothetical protein [Xanthomonas euroxanthea]NIK07744.1 hypothetical protein [Xanthomonas euroxanthea]NJC35750.1 hypothetical protein [Xanthomonas euroxanthea]